jgi:hypothetical protein
MRTIRSSVPAPMLSATAVAMLIATAQAQVSINICVSIAPPPLPYYEQPAIPAEGYTWVPGYCQAVSSAPPQGGSVRIASITCAL